MFLRMLRRLLVVLVGAAAIWLIVFVVFRITDNRLPWIAALAVTYAIGAYVVLPRAIRMSVKILKRGRVPSFTITGDGLPGDPVNLALVGDFEALQQAFAAAGWTGADPLSLKSSIGMARAFVFNKPYPTAPFSTLYLFGRGQDVGFQKPIGDSPRRRHHIRFWAVSLERAEATLDTARFWLNADRPAESGPLLWVGAGTRDTGLSLTKLSLRVTHATDSDTDAEREFVLAELVNCGAVVNVRRHVPGERLALGKVNRYVLDGSVAVADLAPAR